MKAFLEQCYAEGFRNFEYLGRGTSLPHQRIRHEAFCNFVMEHGLTWRGNDFDKLSTPDLAAAFKNLKTLPEVVVAANINRALTIILEAQRRGLQLPDEMRVLCFASVAEQAAPILPYATVALLDEVAVGERAAHLVLERWNRKPGTNPSAHWELLPAQLIQP
jgi:DNA-binding LacI/PurR family transcriptional regulator